MYKHNPYDDRPYADDLNLEGTSGKTILARQNPSAVNRSYRQPHCLMPFIIALILAPSLGFTAFYYYCKANSLVQGSTHRDVYEARITSTFAGNLTLASFFMFGVLTSLMLYKLRWMREHGYKLQVSVFKWIPIQPSTVYDV